MKDIGAMTLTKGPFKGKTLISWDAVMDCTEDCPINDRCPYDRTRRLCELRRRYLESVLISVENGLKGEAIDDLDIVQVGLLLVPLFSQLVTFKIKAHSLGDQIMYGKGVHPVYKEIRQCIRSISDIIGDLKMKGSEKKKGLLDGDSDYYDRMIRNGQVPA